MKIYKLTNEAGQPIAMRTVEDNQSMPEPWLLLNGAEAAIVLASMQPQGGTPVDPVPESVSPRQIRRALNLLGLRAAVEAAIGAAPAEIQDDWEYGLEVRRDWPALNIMANALGLTSEQVDDAFKLAATF